MKRTVVSLIACAGTALLFVVISRLATFSLAPSTVPSASTRVASLGGQTVGEAVSHVKIASKSPVLGSQSGRLVLKQETLSRIAEQLSNPTSTADLVVDGLVVLDRPQEWHVHSITFERDGVIFVGRNNLKLFVAENFLVKGDTSRAIFASFPSSLEAAVAGQNGHPGSSSGAPGGEGQAGTDGINSGNVDLYLGKPPASIIFVDLAGQSGGRGGNGGPGYPGNRGTPGRSANTGFLGCNLAGTTGGPGRPGGNGGDAGPGGNCGASGILWVHAPPQVLDEIKSKSLIRPSTRVPRVGESGYPGKGGPGGEGGEGGAGGGFCSGGSMGPHGPDGAIGELATKREQQQCAPMKMILD